MAYKCPFCGYISNVASLNMQYGKDIQCDQCRLSASDALLRTQEDLVTQFSAYNIGHDDLQGPTEDRLIIIKHTPFASSAAHTIRIPSCYSTESQSQGNTADRGNWPSETSREHTSHQTSPSNPSYLYDNQMDCLPETPHVTTMTEKASRHGDEDKLRRTGANDLEMSTMSDADNAAAEPYMSLGYQKESEDRESRQPPPDVQSKKYANGLPYTLHNDPIFNTQQLWEYSGGNRAEQLYRANEARSFTGDTVMAGLS